MDAAPRSRSSSSASTRNLLFKITDAPRVTQLVNGLSRALVGEPARRLPRARAGDRPHRGDPRRRSSPTSSGRERSRYVVPQIAAIGVLAALIPVITLAADGADRVHVRRRVRRRQLRARVRRASSWSSPTSSLLMSSDYIGDGDYYQGEFYFLMLTSVLGHDGDGLGARPHLDLRRARDDHASRRSCSRGGASTTRSRTRRRSSTS